ncbi:MAG: hypothetical protein Q7R73_00405 [bacterium]|nr:hypothetical protein [bacterium]
MNKLILVVISVAVVVGGGAFYGGMKYAQSRAAGGRGNFANLSPEERQQRLQQFGANAGDVRPRQGGGGFIAGEIISKDDKSVTLKLQDGGSKIVFFSDVTEIVKSISGVSGDLAIGKNITVNGVANSDGSVTAGMIQLRPLSSSGQ